MPDSATITDQTPKEKPVVITSASSKKPVFKFSFVNPKILGAMTVLLLLIGGIGAGVYLTQRPQQTTTQASPPIGVDVTLKPAEVEVAAGSEFSLDIFANAHDNQITSTDLNINYDPAALTLKSITPGQFLPKILVPPDISSGSAFVSLGTDGNSGASGNGIIASLVFEVSNTASQTASQITFNPERTIIKVLNRSPESARDTLGGTKIVIKASKIPETIPPIASAEGNIQPAVAQDSGITDFNNDGFTNTLDLSLLYSGWGDPETDTQKQADLNQDGVINGLDYARFLPKFQR